MLKLVKSLLGNGAGRSEEKKEAAPTASALGEFLDNLGGETKPYVEPERGGGKDGFLPPPSRSSEHIKTEKRFRDDEVVTERTSHSGSSGTKEDRAHKSWDLLMGDEE
jgi:hypothetical protein